MLGGSSLLCFSRLVFLSFIVACFCFVHFYVFSLANVSLIKVRRTVSRATMPSRTKLLLIGKLFGVALEYLCLTSRYGHRSLTNSDSFYIQFQEVHVRWWLGVRFTQTSNKQLAELNQSRRGQMGRGGNTK